MYYTAMLSPGVAQMVTLNPLTYIIQLVREPILEGHAPSLLTYGVACPTILATVIGACFALSRLQKKLIFHL
jgi:ABC-type polysaccharide/polyol phosphate export permease